MVRAVRRRGALRLIGGGLAACAAALSAAKAPAYEDDGPLRAFVAASLAQAFEAVAKAWRAAAGGRAPAVMVSHGSSAGLARQIELGAPADLFVSANTLWMDRLAETGAVAPETRAPLLTNRLALAAAAGQAESLAPRDEIDGAIDLVGALGEDGRLAIARVKSVPLGVYGKQALVSLGLWDSVSGRLAEAQDARAALAYVTEGATPLGVLYASDLQLAEALYGGQSPKRIGLFPKDSHDPIVYPAALTPAGAKRAAARDLLVHLRSPEARRRFGEFGFGFAGS